MVRVSAIHQKLYKHLTDTDWMRGDESGARALSEWIEPVLTGYTAASALGLCLSDVLGRSHELFQIKFFFQPIRFLK